MGKKTEKQKETTKRNQQTSEKATVNNITKRKVKVIDTAEIIGKEYGQGFKRIKNSEKDEEEQKSVQWTMEDKKQFLLALKKYGHKDINAISRMLPKIPPHAIKLEIQKYSALAEHYYYDNAPIDDWLKSNLYRPGDSCLSQALRFIQLFENHPSPSEGHDISAIYDFLYHASVNQDSVLPNIPSKTLNVLCDTLERMETDNSSPMATDIFEYIGNIYNKRFIRNVYPGKRNSTTQRSVFYINWLVPATELKPLSVVK